MPNRILRDWTDSETMALLSAEAERLFNRLIMKVDDFGRLYAKPKLLKSALFPLIEDNTITNDDIVFWLAECQGAGAIRVYKVDQKWYLQIQNFNQRLRQKKEKYPPPPANPMEDMRLTYDGHVSDTNEVKPAKTAKCAHSAVNSLLEEETRNEVETEVETEEEKEKSPPFFPEGQIWDIEKEILKNEIFFEKICMAARKPPDIARESLRKYHLHLLEKETGGYPKSRKALYAGFEKWLMNENIKKNATTYDRKESAAERNSRGAIQILESLREDLETAAGRGGDAGT